MDRKQRDMNTAKRIVDLARNWSDPERRVYSYLTDTYGIEVRRDAQAELERAMPRETC